MSLISENNFLNDETEELTSVDESNEVLVLDNESNILSTTYYPTSVSQLKSHISSANAGDTIVLSGTYKIHDYTISKSLTFIGTNGATFDGEDNRIFGIKDSTVTFKDITFKNGYGRYGGTIDAHSGQIIFDNCKFLKSYAAYRGGTLFVDGTASCKITNSYFTNSKVGDGSGGAIWLERYGEIINCTFEGCSVSDWGGAIRIAGTAAIIENCTFKGCKATCGGAILSEGSTNLKIRGSTFVNCNSKYGGAIRIVSNTQMTIDGCNFINNVASEDSGAISFKESSSVDVLNSYFEENSAKWGGAVLFLSCSGETKLSNCTFKNNHASVDSGAVSGGALYDCTFIGNTADDFGGAASWGSYYNCVFIGNSAKNNGGAVKVGSANILGCEFINNTASNMGGAIFSENGNLKLKNNTFIGNWVTGYHGGAIQISGTSDSIIEDCNFINCHSGDYGGAINSDMGSKTFFEGLKILNCKFIGCYCLNGRGGAVGCDSPLNLNISGCYFDSCYSINDMGGAIRLSTANTAVISNSKFVNCYADKGNGGAIHLTNLRGDNYNVIIDNCDFENNHVYGYGADIDAYHTHNLKVLNCNFINSESTESQGGSIFIRSCSDINICSSYFDSSKSKHSGGSIAIDATDKVKLDELTFSNCSGLYGGSIYITSVSNFALTNSNFTNSKASESGGAIHINPATDVNITGCSFANCSALDRAGSMDIAFTDYILIDKCIIENSTSTSYDGDSIVFSGPSISSVVSDTIFDKNPKNLNYHFYSKLNVNNLSIVKGDDGIISAKLSNVAGPMSNKQVVFTVNGNKYPRTTLSDGVATFSVKDVVTDLGSHKITVSFDGDGINDAVSQTVDVMINMYKATLSVTQSGRDYYGEKSLTFKLVDSKTGAAKSDVPIHAIIYLGEEIYKTADISTGFTGEVTYSMAAFEPGTYKVKAYVTTANVDVNVIELDDIVVSKISGVIELSKSNSNKTLTIKLVNPANGDVYSGIGVKLQFSPNGHVADVVTDSNGEFNYPIQFDPGTYHVLASVDSSGFKEFANAELSNIVISTAGKDDSVIKFSNEIVFDYLKSGSTTVTLEGCSVFREGCSVDNHPEASIVVKDNKITVSGLKAGSYTLRVTSTPDVYHNPVTRTVKITVNKIDSSLTINKAVSFNYGDTGITTVTVNGGSIVKSGVSVEGHSEAIISVVNNEIYVSNLTVGTYTLKVTTSPDSDHNAVNRTTSVTVKKINSIIDFEYPISFVYGGVGSVPLTLEGCEVVREGCSVDNHPEAIINIDKNNVISVSNLSVGSYTLRISSIPDSNHNADTQTIVVTVTKADSDVGISPKSITFDYGGVGSANLDLDGCSVLSDDVSVVGHSEAITRVVNNVVYVSNLTANTYTLQIKTTPDGNHKSVTKKFSVTVNKPLSTVSFRNPVIFDYLGEGTTSMDLNGCTVDLEKISVVGHDEAVISKNNKGVITVSNLTAGSYTLKVVTDPDANHRANTATVAITVNKLDSKVIFTKEYISFKYAESGSTPISLENCKVASMSIVGHDDVKPVLDDDEITVSGLPVGSYVMKVTTDPDDNYNSVDAYINVTVVKNTATITVKKSQTVAYKKSTNWAITLKDSSGKPVSGVKVNLKIYKGNKLYKNVNNLKVTDANGVTNYNAKGLPVGTYKFVVSVSHAGYNVKSVSTPVKVIKQTPVKIILNTKSDKKGAVISIIVKDKAGKKYLNNIKLTLSIKNGKTYNTVTLITGNYKSGKGVSAYSTNMLTVGSHNVKVETADIKYSGSASKNVKVKASAKKYRNWWEKISKGKKTSYGT